METAVVEAALHLIAGVTALAVTAWAARRGTTTMRGIALGVLAGVLTATVLGFALGFLGYVVPFGQLDFWLASLLHR